VPQKPGISAIFTCSVQRDSAWVQIDWGADVKQAIIAAIPFVDSIQEFSVGRVGVAHQWAIIETVSVSPKCDAASDLCQFIRL
jgi:hypothetical protein